MTKNILIIVEGINDVVFIGQLIDSLLETQGKKDKKKYIIQNKDLTIEIMLSDGFTNLIKLRSYMDINTKNGGINLVIFDTDDDQKQKKEGGFKNKSKLLENKAEEMEVKFDYFLLPNHQDDGDLETLLFAIVKDKALFDSVQQCIKSYVNCIRQLPLHHMNIHEEWTNPKAQVFGYINAFEGQEKAKESERNYKNEHLWDLKHNNIEPLINFLKKYF